MVNAHRGKPEALLENYCSRLGTLLEARYTGLALLAAFACSIASFACLAATSASCLAASNASPVYLASSKVPSRIQAGRADLDEQIVAVGELIQSAVRTIAPMAERKCINVDCELAQASTLICADQAKFRQIILNVLSNGVKFTEPEGRILIGSAVSDRGDLVISVKDTGIGIPPDHLERVLSPFEQVADHLTRENEGAGLGLPIARALIELHGGDLTLSSDLGIGTTVALRLPRERIHGVAPVTSSGGFPDFDDDE